MGVKFLHDLFFNDKIVSNFPNNVVAVDLLHLAKMITKNSISQRKTDKLSLVVDGECCLNRLYGGFYSGMGHNIFKLIFNLRLFFTCYSLYVFLFNFYLNIKISIKYFK